MSVSNLLLAAALATAIGAGPAVLARDAGDVSTTVSCRDLDLTTSAGANTMLERISQAAERVCAPKAGLGDSFGRALWNDCVASRIDLVVNRLGSPTVTAAYARDRSNPMKLAEGGTR
ncbi:MAG TPA: UrcA family protein [Caulobacteraceae bacterium]